MNEQPTYDVPRHQLSLAGPVARAEGCALPIRGDIAHIALAERYLVANYVVPLIRYLASDATLVAAPREGADTVATLTAGTRFEVLDIAGSWAWGCIGPEGPAGYLPLTALAQ